LFRPKRSECAAADAVRRRDEAATRSEASGDWRFLFFLLEKVEISEGAGPLPVEPTLRRPKRNGVSGRTSSLEY
jgi:hypothetical protein